VKESGRESSYKVNVDDCATRLRVGLPLMRRSLLALILFASSAIAAVAEAQVRAPDPRGRPPWADTTGESGVYPIGDAVDVYHAVLDLFFVDGDESPSIIVMHDTAESRSNGGPCPIACERTWPHKSKIDTATILAFARLSPKRPRIIPFGYRIPIVFVSWDDEIRMRAEGRARLEQNRQGNYVEGLELVSEYERRYPGAWGRLRLTRVGFNRAHREALVQASFMCGVQCGSDEILFLKKINNQWTVIERIPNDAEGFQPSSRMRYRGPAGRIPPESEILVSLARDPKAAARTEGIDRAMVYRTVLDSLYNFQGESPRRIVVTDWYRTDASALPAHTQPIQRSTLERYTVLKEVRAPLYAKLEYRLPVSILSRDSIPTLERLGLPLQKEVNNSREYSEASPFWLAFRQRYPGAWGMVGFTRVAFNQEHTQALVFTDHTCGETCRNADTWLLDKSGEKWRIVERIAREKDNHWALDSLRYLGVDADPRAYRPRRIHGFFVNAATGRALPGLKAIAEPGSRSYQLTTDSTGRFSVENLPIAGWTILKVPCPAPSHRQPLLVAMVPSHPGLDSTMNVGVDFRRCLANRRARALADGAGPSPSALKSNYPSVDAAGVYRGVFDVLYPVGGRKKGPILLLPFTHLFWEHEIDDEIPRLTRLGLVDSSMEGSMVRLPRDSVWLRPKFDYRRRVVILGPSEQRFLLEQGEEFVEADGNRNVSLLALAKEAYPGADAILSLSQVVFNDAHTQALVQLSVNGSPTFGRGETMLLHKSGTGWRVVRRHLEREETSGERVGDRCEPADVPTTVPTLEQLERIIGDAYITVNPTDPQLRRYAGTSHYRFVRTDTLRRFYSQPRPGDKGAPIRMKGRQRLAVAHVINDSTGKARAGRPGFLDFDVHGATLTFTGDPNVTHGSMEQFEILRVRGREFFGSWFTVSGPTVPFKGYFCGRLR
jgi:hypothetical protein